MPKKTREWSLFVDDERFPADHGEYANAYIARSYPETMYFIEKFNCFPTYATFDHDLGVCGDGIDVLKGIIAYAYANDLIEELKSVVDNWEVHSQNPIGAKRIESLFEDIRRM